MKSGSRHFPWMFGVVLGLCLSAPAHIHAKKSQKQFQGFFSVERDAQGTAMAVKTASTRYIRGGQSVDLVGAVHIGDRAYYDRLNGQFTQYDVLLYELVANPGERPVSPQNRTADSASVLASAMKVLLQLEHQLDCVDYRASNFKHADLSMQQMGQKMAERGDDLFTISLKIMAELLQQQNLMENKQQAPPELPSIDIFQVLAGPDGPLKLKRFLADQFDDPAAAGGFGPTLNQLAITDRNDAAMSVLAGELSKGRTRIGIFYGAAHMPDFERRLVGMGFKREATRWNTAWDLSRGRPVNLTELVLLFQKIMKSLESLE